MSAKVAYKVLFSFFFLIALGSAYSCGSEDDEAQIKAAQSAKTTTKKKELKKKRSSGLVEKDPSTQNRRPLAPLALTQLKETDFIKSPERRDPFEPFLDIILNQQEAQKFVQRDVKLKEYDISDLKLIGIITNIGDPRAMVVVPDGTGFVLKRGDYVGRADFVQPPGGAGEQIQVNWRVARIHGSGKEEERGVYLVRDDPTTTKGVDITRFLALHPIE